jgi:ParB-like chromosome segregation protein Spo0J
MQLPMVFDSTQTGGSGMAKKQTAAVKQMTAEVKKLCTQLKKLGTDEAVAFLNEARRMLHEASPFKDEPVDLVLWVKNETVQANDYNPNSVAPPEMKLLEHSITEDGYTQPIVSWQREEVHEVVDGFHRHRVGKESEVVRGRVLGYLPVVSINNTRLDKGDRMAATIRHNRARGKHRVDAMSEIVIDLKRRRWSDEKIGKELGMDPDEVLRLTQVSGLAELFADRDFSQAWEADRIEEELDEG